MNLDHLTEPILESFFSIKEKKVDTQWETMLVKSRGLEPNSVQMRCLPIVDLAIWGTSLNLFCPLICESLCLSKRKT